jgi:hypothetical protein
MLRPSEHAREARTASHPCGGGSNQHPGKAQSRPLTMRPADRGTLEAEVNSVGGRRRMTDIKVQVVSQDTGEVAFGPTRLPNFAERASELGDSLNEIAARLRERLRELGKSEADGWDLDEVNLSFSLDLQADAGVIVARASSKAGFQAAMSWKRSRPTA